MICKNKKCNAELADDAKFCEKCGKKQGDSTNKQKILLKVVAMFLVAVGTLFILSSSKDSRLLDDSLYASLDFSDMSKNEKRDFFALEVILADFETIEEIQDLAIRLFPDDEEDFNSTYLYGVHYVFGPKESFPLVNTMYDSADERATVKAMLTHNTEEEEEASTNGALSEITIDPDFLFTFERNYDYVKGSLRNGSNKTIRYIEIVARYRNADGEVIDSDYTNETDIAPGESRYFEIMHKTVPGTHSVGLTLNNIRFD